jgi:hypothetical protein
MVCFEFSGCSGSAEAELGSQFPLIQVFTPNRGSTHAWRMIQTTRTPTGIRTSIVFPLLFVEAKLVFIYMSRHYDTLLAKKTSLPSVEPGLDAGHDVCQVGFSDLVVGLAPVFLAGQEATPLHKTQVFGGHVTGDATRLGQFPDRVAASQEHLDDSQPMRVGQGLEAFCRLL